MGFPTSAREMPAATSGESFDLIRIGDVRDEMGRDDGEAWSLTGMPQVTKTTRDQTAEGVGEVSGFLCLSVDRAPHDRRRHLQLALRPERERQPHKATPTLILVRPRMIQSPSSMASDVQAAVAGQGEPSDGSLVVAVADQASKQSSTR
jgi:hypothetical protein